MSYYIQGKYYFIVAIICQRNCNMLCENYMRDQNNALNNV